MDYLDSLLPNLTLLTDFYGTNRHRRLKWGQYIKRQKAYDTIATEVKAGADDVVVVYGDGCLLFNHASRGHPSTPNKHLYVQLKRRFRSRLVNEYRTS